MLCSRHVQLLCLSVRDDAVRDGRVRDDAHPDRAPHAEAAFVHAFCRDRSLLLGVEGYALTSLEVALATPPRPGDVVPQVPAPPPAAAVAA